MASPVASNARPATIGTQREVSVARLYLLRATYLVLGVGLGALIMAELMDHEPPKGPVIPLRCMSGAIM